MPCCRPQRDALRASAQRARPGLRPLRHRESRMHAVRDRCWPALASSKGRAARHKVSIPHGGLDYGLANKAGGEAVAAQARAAEARRDHQNAAADAGVFATAVSALITAAYLDTSLATAMGVHRMPDGETARSSRCNDADLLYRIARDTDGRPECEFKCADGCAASPLAPVSHEPQVAQPCRQPMGSPTRGLLQAWRPLRAGIGQAARAPRMVWPHAAARQHECCA